MHAATPPRQFEQELIIDEKRRIVLNARSLNNYQDALYKRNFFKRYRPDLSESDYFIFKEKWRLGENYLNELRKRLNTEVRRARLQNSNILFRGRMENYDDQIYALSNPHIRATRFHADRDWKEATKIVNWVDTLLERIKKYNLHYPSFTKDVSHQEASRLEDDLKDRFLREMRKPPKSNEAE